MSLSIITAPVKEKPIYPGAWLQTYAFLADKSRVKFGLWRETVLFLKSSL